MFRCPVVNALVSKVSLLGMAPFNAPGASNGNAKQSAFSAGEPGVTPTEPVNAVFGVQPEARGSMGFVIPSKML